MYRVVYHFRGTLVLCIAIIMPTWVFFYFLFRCSISVCFSARNRNDANRRSSISSPFSLCHVRFAAKWIFQACSSHCNNILLSGQGISQLIIIALLPARVYFRSILFLSFFLVRAVWRTSTSFNLTFVIDRLWKIIFRVELTSRVQKVVCLGGFNGPWPLNGTRTLKRSSEARQRREFRTRLLIEQLSTLSEDFPSNTSAYTTDTL